MVEVKDLSHFDIVKICTCGQLFRYKLNGENTTIYTKDKKIIVEKGRNGYKIFCDSDNYAQNYFDLDKNYAIIYSKLKNLGESEFFNKALNFGKGIRILKQDLFETIISFIVSQNNNIPRIQKTIENMCSKFGKNKGDYYAFPTIDELSLGTVDDFKNLGLGYRADYIVSVVESLKTQEFNLDTLSKLPTIELKEKLLKLKGIGPKVCDCILLFGFSRFDSFPADTWIKQLYVEDYGGNEKDDTKKVSKFFVNKFGSLSGYAQQYLYFYKREI